MKEKEMAAKKVKFACERLTAKKMNRTWGGGSKGTDKGGPTSGQPKGNYCICGCQEVR
jgi:hypothetical protein